MEPFRKNIADTRSASSLPLLCKWNAFTIDSTWPLWEYCQTLQKGKFFPVCSGDCVCDEWNYSNVFEGGRTREFPRFFTQFDYELPGHDGQEPISSGA